MNIWMDRNDLWVLEYLDPLRDIQPRRQENIVRGRDRFMTEVRFLRASRGSQPGKGPRRTAVQPDRWLHLVVGALVILVALFVTGGVMTAFAQHALPGDALYSLKIWAEDAQLLLATEPQDDLALALNFTDVRLSELSTLIAEGDPVPAELTVRLQEQLELALQTTLRMPDRELAAAMVQVQQHTEQQQNLMLGLMFSSPDHPLLLQITERLREQTRLAVMGQVNPGGFRLEMQERLRLTSGPGGSATPGVGGSQQTPGAYGPGGAQETPGAYGPGPGGATGTPGPYGPGGSQETPGSYGPGYGDTQETPGGYSPGQPQGTATPGAGDGQGPGGGDGGQGPGDGDDDGNGGGGNK